MTAGIAWEHHRDRIAEDVGRLRRRAEAGSSLAHLADRIAASLDSIDSVLEPTAGELVQVGYDVDQALEHVDRHRNALYSRMGGRA